MDILITGAKGFIGSNLVKTMSAKHSILKMYHSSEYSRFKNHIYCDMTNGSHIAKLLSENINIDVLIHAASVFATSDNISRMSLFYDNVRMYENLIKIANKYKPKQIINLSSIAVYPNKTGEYTEESEIRPSKNAECLYGLSKFCGENLLDFYLKDIDILHLRLSQVYGEGMREDRIMKVMEKELKDNNSITVFGNGERVSNFIDIDSVCNKISSLLGFRGSNIFNVGGENISYKSLAETILKRFGNVDSVIKLVDIGVDSKTLINCNKIKEALNESVCDSGSGG